MKLDLDLDEYIPFFLRSIANRLTQIDRRLYSNQMGIGVNEWSCLSLLAREPNITATRICEVGGYDKSVISRSIRSLERQGLISTCSAPGHNRKQLLSLTDRGHSVYATIEKLVLAREKALLKGITALERRSLIEMLRRILTNSDCILEQMQTDDKV